MSLGVVAELAVRSTVMFGGAWIAAAVIQTCRGSAATRHAIWIVAFATIAFLPLLSRVLPSLPLPILPPAPDPQFPAATGALVSQVPVPSKAAFDVPLLIYLAVAALLIGRLALGRILLDGMWGKALPADEPQVGAERICDLLGIKRRVLVRISTEQIAPMTWGSFAPRILLPRKALSWSPERMQRVLLHELGHVSRHDSLTILIANGICAFYWANPFAWSAVHQMRLAQEQACDDFVLSHGIVAARYAGDLVDSACSLRSRPVAGAVAMTGTSDLEKRVRSILSNEPYTRLDNIVVTAVAGLAALGGIFAATVVPVEANPALPQVHQQSQASQSRREALASGGMVTEPSSLSILRPQIATTARLTPASLATSQGSRTTLDPVAEYHQELARYHQQLRDNRRSYEGELENYRRDLNSYARDNERYLRDLERYRSEMATIGPGEVPPVEPVAPVVPVPPVEPVADVPPVPPIPPPAPSVSS